VSLRRSPLCLVCRRPPARGPLVVTVYADLCRAEGLEPFLPDGTVRPSVLRHATRRTRACWPWFAERRIQVVVR
jgi:hypothetical protein